jgi:glycosyltransferase involved in cell wall biosynthesis
MKIGVNILPYRKIGGPLVYAHNMLKALGEVDKENEYYLIGYKDLLSPLVFGFPNFHYIETSLNPFSEFQRVFVEQFTLPRILKKHKINLLYNLSVSSPLFWKGKIVSTVHDCTYRKYRQGRGLGAILYLETMFYLTPRLSKKVIAVSEFTKKELIKIYKIPTKKIKVIFEALPEIPQNGVSFSQLQSKFGIRKPYLFWIGVSMPWKNIPRLIDAFGQFSKKYPSYCLVLAGQLSQREEKNIKVQKNNIVYIGKVSDQEKTGLYKNCSAFVFPSLYEGFGLPILEAQSLGVPIVTSNTASLPEVAGKGALYVNPYDTESIIKGMEAIVLDNRIRKELITRGFENVKKFSWQKSAEELLKVFSSL